MTLTTILAAASLSAEVPNNNISMVCPNMPVTISFSKVNEDKEVNGEMVKEGNYLTVLKNGKLWFEYADYDKDGKVDGSYRLNKQGEKELVPTYFRKHYRFSTKRYDKLTSHLADLEKNYEVIAANQ